MDTVLDRRWKCLLWVGISTIVLGAICAITPFQLSLTFEIWVGLIFLVAGLGHALYSFWSRAWGGFYFQLIGATHYLLIGLMLLANPSLGMEATILLLSLLFIMQGMVHSLCICMNGIFNKGDVLCSFQPLFVNSSILQ